MYIPSEEMGDYEEARNRRKSSGPLYPLSEEGRYGPPPKEKPKPRPPLPGYEKRDRKSKVYASYAVSNDCCMHSHKLDKNEQGQATRGKTPPSRKESTSSRRDSVPRRPSVPPPQPSAPTNLSRQNSVSRRSSAPRQPSVARRESMSRSSEERSTKWQATLARDNSYSTKPQSWKDSLRGGSARDSVSPPPRQQRRPSSTLNRKPKRKESESPTRPRRGRTTSSSPDTRRQSSPGMSGMNGGGRGSSADWGYTNFASFQANRKSSEVSQNSRKSSAMTDRSSMGRQSLSNHNNTTNYTNNSNGYSSSGYNSNNSGGYNSNNRDYTSSERDYAGGGGNSYMKPSRRSGDFSGMNERSIGSAASNSFSSSTYSKSTGASKIGLKTLKTPVISEWDDMGILGLSSKMFKDSSVQQQDSFSSSSFMRRESVTTKVM